MKAEEFKRNWDGRLVQFPASSLKGIKIPKGAQEFLTVAGLPDECSPDLSFEAPDEGVLPRLSDEIDAPGEFDHLRVIGYTGDGDTVCLDETDDGAVVVVVHDRDNEVQFVNTSVHQLAQTLLLFSEMAARAEHGGPAYDDEDEDKDIDFDSGENAFADWFSERVEKIDSSATEDGSFWPEATEKYLADLT